MNLIFSKYFQLLKLKRSSLIAKENQEILFIQCKNLHSNEQIKIETKT